MLLFSFIIIVSTVYSLKNNIKKNNINRNLINKGEINKGEINKGEINKDKYIYDSYFDKYIFINKEIRNMFKNQKLKKYNKL